MDTETVINSDELKTLNPKKYAHLKPNTKYYGLSATPESFVVGAIYGHNYSRVFHSISDMRRELEKPQFKNKIVFAHNAEYDLSVLYGNVYQFDNEAVYNGKFIKATNGVAQFADSMNIMRFAAAKIGAMIGKPKLSDLEEEMKKPFNGVTPEIINYCLRDCEIIYDALFEMFETVGDIKITQASLSMSYFRRNFLPFDIEYNDNLIKYFYNSYFGGRTEAFKLGKCKGKVIDINSSYPYAMVNCVFPNPKYLKRITNVSKDSFSQMLDTYEGCAKVKVYHKETEFGFLPHKINHKLCFPIGHFTGWFNFNELRFALENGAVEILQIKEVIFSKAMESPFKEFVNELYSLRKIETSELRNTIYKLLLNSLYGKFAQRLKEEIIYIPNMDQAMDLIKEKKEKGLFIKISLFNKERLDCFLHCRREKVIEMSHSIPSFASYITSFARIHLLKKMIKHSDKGVLYTDTDSVFFATDPEIEDSNELGGWGIEDKTVLEIRGLKNYTYEKDGKIFEKIKGVPTHKAVKIGEHSYQYESLIKTKESLRRNVDNGKLALRGKTIKNVYDKRIVLNDGRTKPIKL